MRADSMDVAFNVHVCLKLNAGIGIGHFDRNKISFWVIKYHVNTAQHIVYLILPPHIVIKP